MGRASADLAKRIALVMATGLLAVGATISAVQMITRTMPGAVANLRGGDPVALATDAEVRLATVAENPAAAQNVADLATRSLRLLALNPVALRQLAIARVLSGQKQAEAPLMQMSNTISRRDVGAQLWLIDSNVRRNDIPAVLRAYDTALRTSASSWPVLFPLLNAAIDEPSIQIGLRPYWSRPSAWRDTFIAQAIASSPHPDALATMTMRDNMLAAVKDRAVYTRNLIAALLDHHQFAVARALALRSGFRPQLLVSPELSSDSISGTSGRLGWQFADLPDRGSAMKSTTTLGVFANQGGSGGVGSKILYVPAGAYRLRTRFGEIRMPAGADLQWRLSCLGPGDPRVIWSGQTDAPRARGRRDEALVIPVGCPSQLLELSMSGGDNPDGAEAEITAISLDRTR